ncbi:MAG: T9SS type A sorting domain-containing protein, partial [Ignavibacteria bacterium]|nr:T9SS type A sorting domain-containing protein [Ignavibacteria bacterium]
VNPAGIDFSIQDFPAGGGIEILQPNVTGIKLLRGTQYLISWIGSMTYPVKIELVKGGVLIPGGFLPGNPTSASIVGSTFIWTIDPTTVLDDDYRIRITRLGSPVIADESAEEFEITNSLGGTIEVLNPMGGEFWYIGNSYLLSWNDNLAESVNIDLYETDETTPKYNIATNVPGTTHIWNTTGHLPITGGSYKIKVSSSLVPSIKDFSAAFTLACLPLTFTVYPNPANNYVTIKFDESANESYTYQLKDRFNMTLSSNRVDAASDKEVQITTAQLPNGIYFLTVTSDKTKTTQKIMIQH